MRSSGDGDYQGNRPRARERLRRRDRHERVANDGAVFVLVMMFDTLPLVLGALLGATWSR